MSDILIEVQGSDAVAATEELLSLPEITGTYETEAAAEREAVTTTIATIVGIVGGTLAIALIPIAKLLWTQVSGLIPLLQGLWRSECAV